MAELNLLIAALFLPLFPLSMVFNIVFARVRQPLLRAALLLGWPQIGLLLLHLHGAEIPGWLIGWALFTATLYAFRALTVKEVGLWIGFLATSAWALLWLTALDGMEQLTLRYEALGFSAPLMLLVLLAANLEKHFGAAYSGLHGGLAQTAPRFAGVLVVVLLAVIATPLFPGFFAMLATMVVSTPATAAGLAVVWLLWTWAGARLLQGLVVGPASAEVMPDISRIATWSYAMALGGLMIAGVALTGGLP